MQRASAGRFFFTNIISFSAYRMAMNKQEGIEKPSFVITLTVTYHNGAKEEVHSGDIFYWPPGHTVKVDNDAEFVLFSPQHEHTAVFDHINSKLSA
jgi:glyoxylate utilization-related uncharacterized protein